MDKAVRCRSCFGDGAYQGQEVHKDLAGIDRFWVFQK